MFVMAYGVFTQFMNTCIVLNLEEEELADTVLPRIGETRSYIYTGFPMEGRRQKRVCHLSI